MSDNTVAAAASAEDVSLLSARCLCDCQVSFSQQSRDFALKHLNVSI